jgi:hypothetical protein
MLEVIFTSIIPLALLLALTFFITVTLHELGHAIPALLMTRGEVTIYIGSLGDPYKSFRVSFGRLTMFCKYNPLFWYKGCCVALNYDLSIDQQLFFVAGGPVASLLGTLGSWRLLSAMEEGSVFRIVSGSVFTISLIITLSTIFPSPRVRYTPSGHPVYNDSYQIFRLIRMKYR